MTTIRNETTHVETGTITVEIIDTDARTVTVEIDGVVQSTRPFTATENELQDAADEAAEREANEAALRADPQTHIDILLTAIDALNGVTAMTNATINQNPAAVIKTVTREVLTVARRTVRLARLTLGVTDSTDTGD